MQGEGLGAFVRMLVPIRLTGGYAVTFGAWLGVHPQEQLERVYRLWDAPEYPTLQFHGPLANALPPWESDTLGMPLHAAVLTPCGGQP